MSFYRDAREHLTGRLLEGEKVNGFTLAEVLDGAVNDNPRARMEEIAGHFAGIADGGGDEHAHVERRVALQKWLERIIDAFLDRQDDFVRETAADMARAYMETQAPGYEHV